MTRPPASRNDAADGFRWVRIWRPTLDRVDPILALTVVVAVVLLDLADRISADVLNEQAAEVTNEILQSPVRLDRLTALDELATENRRALDERHAVRVLTGTEISEVPRGERTVG